MGNLKKLTTGIKFTEPQQKVVDKLLKGWLLTENMNQYWWVDEDGEMTYGGRVYKPLCNIVDKINKLHGLGTTNFSDFKVIL